MPEKFTFPSIDQAMSLQSAQSMEDVKAKLRKWFNQNNTLRLSENVAWSFKLINTDNIQKRYIHCHFCQAKLQYVRENSRDLKQKIDKNLSAFKLTKFNLHHDHRMIESVKQRGKMKTFPQNYGNKQFSRFSIQKQRRDRQQKLRKKRHQINKFKKLQFYYRLDLTIKQSQKHLLNLKQITAKSIGISVQRFTNFMNSQQRGIIQFNAIKRLLKRTGFQKYNVEIDNTNKIDFKKSLDVELENDNQQNSQDQEHKNQKQKISNPNSVVEQTRQFFKEIMIFVNYNRQSKRNLQASQGLINITHFEDKIINKKFMKNMKWETLLLYSHDSNFTPNQIYAIIMIQTSNFNIRQIKKSFEITFRLLNPMKKVHIQCCIHQQSIYIMGALDLIIEQGSLKRDKKSQKQVNEQYLSYFLSPKLSANIINKCEFIPKVFRKKVTDKIFQFDQKQVDSQFERIITQLEKASKIKEYAEKTKEYLSQLKQFRQNFHKIFVGKFLEPRFIGLAYSFPKGLDEKIETSFDDLLTENLSKYSDGNKNFMEFLIMILQIFQIPRGSFIYHKHQGDTRQSTRLETNYADCLMMQDYELFDKIKRFYNKKALKGKYYKQKNPQKSLNGNADFFDQFCALLYERVYKIKEVFMKVAPEAMIFLMRQIQKSFTLQIQTKTIQQIKKQGFIKAKQANKQPYTITLVQPEKFWPSDQQNQMISKNKNLIELEKANSMIELENSEQQKKDQKNRRKDKKVWECDCNLSKFTFLPCSHQIRCCLTFFTSIQDQVNDFWLFNPKSLENMEHDSNKSDILTEDEEYQNEEEEKQGQNNSQSD